MWIFQESPAHDKLKDDLVLISWMHTHVQGAPCGFSAIDMHTQFSYGMIYPGILGTVFEIDEQNRCRKFDWYELTEKGQDVVKDCNRKHGNRSSIQHYSCSSIVLLQL